jgi:hypothetical protein
MRSLHLAASFMFAGIFCVAWAGAATPATDVSTPAATPATPAAPAIPDGAMKVYITDVVGLVQVRDSDTDPWRAATVQMIISEGAELRTGPHSSVTCVIPPDQTFTLDRLGTVRVEEAAKHGDKITTDLIMKYGRTHYDIEGAGQEHEASIISPSSTLAVRGTNVVLYDQPPYKPEAISITGRAAFLYHHSTVYVGEKHGSRVRAVAGTDGAAQTGVDATVVDPNYSASLTASDSALFATEVARGAVISYDPIAQIPVVTGGRPSYDSELPGDLPGDLDFVLRWTGDAYLNIEVGLDKGDPLTILSTTGFVQGEFLYPGFGLQDSPSGGHIPFEDRGGPTGGEEIAYWSGNYPEGLYGIAAQSMSGATTSFTFDVYAHGVAQTMYYFTPSFEFVKSTQMTQTLSAGENATAVVLIPAVAVPNVPDDPAGNPNPGITPSSFSSAPSVVQASPAIHVVSPLAVQKQIAAPLVQAASDSRFLSTPIEYRTK